MSHPVGNGNRWTDEAERLTEGMPEGPETEQLRRTIRSNVELLSQMPRATAPESLWAKVEAGLRQEPVIVPMPGAGAASRKVWAAALAAALAVAVGVAWYVARPGTTPDTDGGRFVARPTAEQTLAALTAAFRSAAFEGTAVVEEFPSDAPNAAPIRRELRIAYDGAAGNWRITPTDPAAREIIRNGARQFVRQPGAEGKAEWTVGLADELGRVPPDNLSLDAAAVAANYNVTSTADETVAGRECRVVSVQPKSAGRPGLKLWVDAATGVRLKSERLDAEGRVIARTTFREFAGKAGFPAHGPFEPPVSVGNDAVRVPVDFQAERDRSRLGFVPFAPAQLPAGFAPRRSVLLSPATGLPALRTTYSDGLAVFEVYQQASATGRDAGPTYRRTGRVGEVSLDRGGVSITVAGELDRAGLEAVAAGLVR